MIFINGEKNNYCLSKVKIFHIARIRQTNYLKIFELHDLRDYQQEKLSTEFVKS